jgi:hypothetical protein
MTTTTGLPASSSTRLVQMTLRTELFEKQYIDRDSTLLDSACFNHIFNNKKWFIEYEDIEGVSTGASNGSNGTAIGKGVVKLPLVLPDGSLHHLELPNTLYQPSTPCNLISVGQLERNEVYPDPIRKVIYFKNTGQILGQYRTILTTSTL